MVKISIWKWHKNGCKCCHFVVWKSVTVMIYLTIYLLSFTPLPLPVEQRTEYKLLPLAFKSVHNKFRHICLTLNSTFLLDNFALPLTPIFSAFLPSIWNPLDNTTLISGRRPVGLSLPISLHHSNSTSAFFSYPSSLFFQTGVCVCVCVCMCVCVCVCVWIDSSLIAPTLTPLSVYLVPRPNDQIRHFMTIHLHYIL